MNFRGHRMVYIVVLFYSHADLNELLDSNKDRDKLEAMRRVIEVCCDCFNCFFVFLFRNFSM